MAITPSHAIAPLPGSDARQAAVRHVANACVDRAHVREICDRHGVRRAGLC